MKKIFVLVLMVPLVFSLMSCSRHISPAAITVDPTPTVGSSGGYLNNGRLQSQSMSVYMGMTITTNIVYFYDPAGKIMREENFVMGMPGGTTVRTHTPAGKLSVIDYPASMTSAEDIFYIYDGAGRFTNRYAVDTSSATVDAMVFTYDGSNRISRIDESQNGTPSCYRLITRDVSGKITREDIYPPGGGTALAYVDYQRNDTLKTLTLNCYFGLSGLTFQEILRYDPSGFLQSQEIVIPVLSMTTTMTNTLQAGLFDPAGMNGYYYSDADAFGAAWIYFSVSGFGAP